ncbi:MAG: MATE family efflux transporter, partial [Oscillospiraceae bacterium]|nr:MATE family efflux transporter [Oscillospiraceae bacterium]
AFIFAGLNIFTSSFFTALNNGGVSAAISFLRTLVFQMLSVLILPAVFGLEGIWWAVAVAEFAAFIVSLVFLFAKREKYHYL